MTASPSVAHADHVERVTAHVLPATPSELPITPLVDVSWRRCLRDFKLDPARDYEPTVLDRHRVRELQTEHEELVQIARAEMDALYEQIAGSGYALLLADTEGVILCEKVDPTLRSMFVRAGLIVGAEWSERREGTNGIGTCAAEARPITIHEADHFRSRHIGLSCSAAPIHDSSGRLIAVLDASCVNAGGTRESQMHTVALVNTSARLIEKCLFLRRHREEAMLRFHHRPEFVDLLHDGAIAVSPDGTIVATDTTGMKLLGAHARSDLIGCSIEEIFDTSYAELLACARAERRAVWELRDNRFGRRYYASLIAADGQSARSAPIAVPPSTHEEAPCDAHAAPMSLADLAGDDPQMLRNLRNARRIADSNVPVVIFGPTGSGKEVFARALHLASNRARQPFVAINCAAIPESLLESELFGYAKGAFTGASKDGMRGRIAQSSGGTLFLDEIGDMPLLAQTRLLRVLEDMEVTPLGAQTAIKVDLRVMCASHRNLREMMARGEFREDLYYRLNGICMELPALAQRADKEALIRRCIARESRTGSFVSIEPAALSRLLCYPWPGNVRELRNAIRTAIAISSDGVIHFADLPHDLRRHVPPARGLAADAVAPAGAAESVSLQGAERMVLLKVIDTYHWNMTLVARHLKISRNTLYRKIKRHAIEIQRDAGDC